MELYSINAGNFRLDGGAMFGVVPKSLWQKLIPADSNNTIPLCTRCLLIQDGNKLILIDTGMGDKQSEKFFGYYYLWGEDTLSYSMKKKGFHPDDVTDVFLTHLHFDHCGGSIKKTSENSFETTFKNATYWSNKKHWSWATNPNAREGASFLNDNIYPIEKSGQLKLIEKDNSNYLTKTPIGLDVLFVDGHTEKQMIPFINYNGQKIAFSADLIPTASHIPLPYIMSYDVRPLVSMKEKEKFLSFCYENNVLLFFEHDANVELGMLKNSAQGIRLRNKLRLTDL